MAWHRIPLEGAKGAHALIDFAIALETQLDGFELAYVVEDPQRFGRFLPRLRQMLNDRAVLIVLDNIESLLSPQGNWQDERWGRLIEALTSHEGHSRLVITSRHVPRQLGTTEQLLVERVDGLSPQESVILALQLPNLRSLFHSGGEGPELARRVLETVQGNPKLIELADGQAADIESLRARLNEATVAWGRDPRRLHTFFATGQPDDSYSAQDFLHTLERWTIGALERLSTHTRTALDFLCALEDADRTWHALNPTWPRLWERLGHDSDAPDLRPTLETVAAHGLIEIQARTRDRPERYRIHPAVEHVGRRAFDSRFQTVVDTELKTFWGAVFGYGFKEEASSLQTHLVIEGGLSAAPYLLRLDEPSLVVGMLEEALGRTGSSSHTLAAALPYLSVPPTRAQERTEN